MTVYKTDGLNGFQKFQRNMYQCPEGSLSHWGVKKIEYYYRNERVKINVVQAHICRRILVLALPIFNLLDALHYIPMSLYKFVTLKPKDALYDLLKCMKCMQVFICTVPALLVAVIEPKLLFRTDGMWLDVKNAQVKAEITHKYEKIKIAGGIECKAVDHLREACEAEIDKMVGNPKAVEVLKNVLEQVISEVPEDDPEKQEIVIEQYIEMFSELLVCSAHQQVDLQEISDNFTKMLELIIKVRNPLLRLSLIRLIVDTAKRDPETYKDFSDRSFDNVNRQALPYMVARHFTDNEELLARLMDVSKESYFKNRARQTEFLATLHQIHESDISKSIKKTALVSLLDSFELDQRISAAKKPVQYKKGEPKNAQERDEQIKDKASEVKCKQRRIDQLDESKNRQKFKLQNQINRLNKEIETLELMTFLTEKEKGELLSLDKDSGSHFESAQDILRMILSLNDSDLISNCLNSVGTEKAYHYLSDDRIVTDIFVKVFELEELPYDAFIKIQQLRAPWALVAFHGRLAETKSKYRSDLYKCSRQIVKSLLDGTYDELRHETDTNPTLKKVFEARSDLKSIWMSPSKSYKVEDLYPAASRRFADFNVVEATDPSDILLIGNDTHTCVHLGGRIERVVGMSAFIRDGKIHTVLIKNNEGVTVAETQLQLMWDEKNSKPVLFVEQANFLGAESNDYSLEHAIYDYARKRAEELRLDLVTCYKMKDPKGKLMSSQKYKGKVSSLGSSSPLEYVNRYFKNFSKPYELGQTYHVAMA